MDLNLNLKQTQTLSPQMVQSMKILQMGSQELLEYIEDTLQENPVLEADQAYDQTDRTSDLQRKLEWLESTDAQNRYYHLQDREDEVDPLAVYGGADAGEENLYFYVLSQLQVLDLPDPLGEAARFLVESLNSNGYLDEPLADLARDFGADEALMERALAVVQALEPAGIAARSLGECLCLQLQRRREEDTALAQKIALGQLDALSKGHYAQIAKALDASPAQVRSACDLIRTLNPKPGTGFAARENLTYINPDLFVVSFHDHFELLSNDYFFPTLRLSSYYTHLMGDTEDAEVREYLTDKVRQAKWVVHSIEQRRSTLLSCAQCILEVQETFFRKGPGHLVPMGLADVAARLGVHESTVSRAIKDKYIQCSQGVYPLSYFFSRSLGGGSGQEGASPDAAKALLKKLVAEEDKRKPLSDQTLCAMMAERGCRLSRRTVAKYRDELDIPATSRRREHD